MTDLPAIRYSQAEYDACKRAITEVAGGGNLFRYLKDIGLPNIRFYELVESIPVLSGEYARAKRARAEFVAQDIVEIADTEEDAQRARNRIQARQWYASKILPKEYGDRMDINVSQTIDIGSALAEARARVLRPVCDQSDIVDVQAVDLTGQNTVGASDKQSSTAESAALPAPAKRRGRPPKGGPKP